jgi:hypothetical protein
MVVQPSVLARSVVLDHKGVQNREFVVQFHCTLPLLCICLALAHFDVDGFRECIGEALRHARWSIFTLELWR